MLNMTAGGAHACRTAGQCASGCGNSDRLATSRFEIARDCSATTVPIIRSRNEWRCVSCACHGVLRQRGWFWRHFSPGAKPRTHRICAVLAANAQPRRGSTLELEWPGISAVGALVACANPGCGLFPVPGNKSGWHNHLVIARIKTTPDARDGVPATADNG